MNTETTILQVLLYSGILLYLGYTMGKQNHREIIRKTIDGLANSGFLKWYWKDGKNPNAYAWISFNIYGHLCDVQWCLY